MTTKKRQKKELFTFFTALAVIAVFLIAGIAYVKGWGGGGDQTNLLADVSNVVAPRDNTVTTTNTFAATTSVPLAAVTSSAPIMATTTKPTPKNITPTSTQSPVPTPPPTPKPAPAPAPTPTPTPAPKPPAPTKPATQASISLPYAIGTFNNGFADSDGWLNWWGNSSQPNGVLTVGANASSTGGGVLLSGSNNWSDYTFQTNLDWLKGETFGIIARYVDNKNYVVCEFDSQPGISVRMTIEQFVNGKQINLASGDIPNYSGAGEANIRAAIQVYGSNATCAFNGYTISTLFAETNVNPVQNGRIGFTTWDAATGNSEIVIHSIGVVSEIYNLGTVSAQNPQD